MPQGGVVQRGHVPEGVGADPERQRDERVGQRAHEATRRDPPTESRRHAEDEQQRRPLGEDDVLEEMAPDEVLRARVSSGVTSATRRSAHPPRKLAARQPSRAPRVPAR